jgi:DNA repair exonuclease SbcCD ATPase subunit
MKRLIGCIVFLVLNPSLTVMTTHAANNSPQGPETMDFPEEKVGVQGNWVKKKEWLLKSNEVNSEIQDLAIDTESARKIFGEKYAVVDQTLDTFYKELGFQQGKIQELFDNISRYLEKKRKKEIEALGPQSKDETADKDINLKIDLLEQKINSYRTELEQLKLDMKSVEDLDKSVSDRMKRLDEQIASTLDESTRAKSMINDLWNIIDDKKARAIYYELKGSTLEKLKAINSYLKEDLVRDFDTVTETIKTHIAKTQEAIKKLEEKGFFIKNRAERVRELKVKDLEALDAKKADEAALLTEKPAEKKRKKQSAWYEQLYEMFINTLSTIYSWCTSLYHALLGTQPQSTLKKISKPAMTSTSESPQAQVSQPVQPLPTLPAQAQTLTSTLSQAPSLQMPTPQMPAPEVPTMMPQAPANTPVMPLS